ncbi:hypothetical protein K438DRAFT_1941500 [Mycena galopus ATCC 62051]|nr:hypothetical protein K438DRAFT_1941500 [Mycena galopus ATCC 62051]
MVQPQGIALKCNVKNRNASSAASGPVPRVSVACLRPRHCTQTDWAEQGCARRVRGGGGCVGPGEETRIGRRSAGRECEGERWGGCAPFNRLSIRAGVPMLRLKDNQIVFHCESWLPEPWFVVARQEVDVKIKKRHSQNATNYSILGRKYCSSAAGTLTAWVGENETVYCCPRESEKGLRWLYKVGRLGPKWRLVPAGLKWDSIPLRERLLDSPGITSLLESAGLIKNPWLISWCWQRRHSGPVDLPTPTIHPPVSSAQSSFCLAFACGTWNFLLAGVTYYSSTEFFPLSTKSGGGSDPFPFATGRRPVLTVSVPSVELLCLRKKRTSTGRVHLFIRDPYPSVNGSADRLDNMPTDANLTLTSLRKF